MTARVMVKSQGREKTCAQMWKSHKNFPPVPGEALNFRGFWEALDKPVETGEKVPVIHKVENSIFQNYVYQATEGRGSAVFL